MATKNPKVKSKPRQTFPILSHFGSLSLQLLPIYRLQFMLLELLFCQASPTYLFVTPP